MGVFDKKSETPKDEKKQQRRSSFAFVEDDSLGKEDTKDLNEFVSSGRGQGKRSLNPKGRPKLDQGEKKEEKVVIYLSKEQKGQLEDRAKKASISVSKYAILKIFGID